MSKTKFTLPRLDDDDEVHAANLKTEKLAADAVAKRAEIDRIEQALSSQRSGDVVDADAQRLLNGDAVTATAIFSTADVQTARRELAVIERAQSLHTEHVKQTIGSASIRAAKAMRPEFVSRLNVLRDAVHRLADANAAVKRLYEQVDRAGFRAGSVFTTGCWLPDEVCDLADYDSRSSMFLRESQEWMDGGAR